MWREKQILAVFVQLIALTSRIIKNKTMNPGQDNLLPCSNNSTLKVTCHIVNKI